MAKCKICGAEFVPYRIARQTLCGSPKCKAENKRIVRARREGRKPTDRTPRPCTVCGELYVPHQTNQTTCSNFHCKVEGRKLAAGRRYHAKHGAVANREHIECPFPKMQTMIPGLSTWDCPEMDPLSGGFPMITFNVPNVAREVAA